MPVVGRHLPFKDEAGGVGPCDNAQVWSPHCWLQIGFFGRETQTVLLRDLIGGEAILSGAVYNRGCAGGAAFSGVH